MKPWLIVVGVGDDGLAGLGPEARTLVDGAELLVGGARHQAMVGTTVARRLDWTGGIEQAAREIATWRGRRVVVLATGDPMCFGAGANLSRYFDAAEMRVLPVPGAFSLAAARMLWSLPDVETLTVHGRPLETLAASLAPGVRMLVLSYDGDTPAAAAALLVAHGYGPSVITVLEHLGGPNERRIDGIAQGWQQPRCADLNTLAIECRADAETRGLSRTPGLPDESFENDGQLTKREVRAATIAKLAPAPGQLLWDVGAGSGSISIEWLRALPPLRTADGRRAAAVAIERDGGRCAAIARNAARLGTPQLAVVHGEAPEALSSLRELPDAVFIGGGLGAAGTVDACWEALRPGGRLVANAVTLEGTAQLLDLRDRRGGELSRMSVSHVQAVGRLTAFKPLMEVVQYLGTKP